ncbi:hypothetical protein [Pseudophaeobacter sp. A-200-2]|uniref:hypothetical protein n=1 Tax=Pseudophaeobacter sp. A-200-2 TaxID=3098145 RepID=UPI0034D7839C
MTRNSWHIARTSDTLTLSRCLPARFDLAVETMLPDGDSLRLAHQIRQDMWRALQDVRGFSPVVRVAQTAEGVRVTAGGRVLGLVSPVLAERIEAVLENPANRGRWLRHAARGQGADL